MHAHRTTARSAAAILLSSRWTGCFAVLGTAWLLSGGVAQAQTYPNQTIRLIVPYAPGGTTDIIARQLAHRMSEKLGQQVIVENKSGANTAIGADLVARSKPDGYTLLLTNDATFVLNPVVLPGLTYNVSRDFIPVATIGYVPLVMAVPASLPVNSMKALTAYAKDRPHALSYGSFGNGSQPHLMGELFNKLAGTDLTHVPYSGRERCHWRPDSVHVPRVANDPRLPGCGQAQGVGRQRGKAHAGIARGSDVHRGRLRRDEHLRGLRCSGSGKAAEAGG